MDIVVIFKEAKARKGFVREDNFYFEVGGEALNLDILVIRICL
jgi:hypothetical protein